MALTDKAIKSKASLTFADAPHKERPVDFSNSDPRPRKGSNRSVSGNNFGDRFLSKSGTKEVQQMAQLMIQGSQGKVFLPAKQGEFVQKSTGHFSNMKIQSAQNTLSLRGNSRGQGQFDHDSRDDMMHKKSSMGSYIHHLVKKPVLGIKSNGNQGYLINGFRQGGINPMLAHQTGSMTIANLAD